ncbi:hypothetical protein PYCCODRAFT_227329 [Trametes coccinea BRFM310]|uniref:Uncharacterized protein n=1 Tax=Trametes coccinea (strain BRFM310) TaxID=1353009 RepID=A0A1Y2ITJ9_TRAC3|nr:hypothetical protein PYCCODRAFT_227329 [Trametes coccinea BRFM310]
MTSDRLPRAARNLEKGTRRSEAIPSNGPPDSRQCDSRRVSVPYCTYMLGAVVRACVDIDEKPSSEAQRLEALDHERECSGGLGQNDMSGHRGGVLCRGDAAWTVHILLRCGSVMACCLFRGQVIPKDKEEKFVKGNRIALGDSRAGKGSVLCVKTPSRGLHTYSTRRSST